MSKARTYTRTEMSDAAAFAAMHNVRVIMHPTGEIEFAPKSFAVINQKEDKAETFWREWEDGRKAGGRA